MKSIIWLRHPIFIPVFGLIMQSVWAADNVNEQDYLQEFPIVLSASRLSQPLPDAPNAMTVLNRRTIEASGFRNIQDLFMLVPGMYVSYYSGNQAIVSYHGTTTGQDAPGMQVLIDGRSVYLQPFDIVDWTLLPITVDDIERIEVIRGPAAASYGENSTRGVINIITRDASEAHGASLSTTHGNGGINDASMHFGGQGEKFDYHATVAYTADKGFDDLSTPPNGLTLAQVGGYMHDSYDNNQARLFNARASFRPDAANEFDVQLGFNHDVMGVGLTYQAPLNGLHDRIAYENMQQIDWLHHVESDSDILLRYYHIQHDTSETIPNTSLGNLFASVISQRNEIELQHTLRTSQNNRLVYGAGYRQEQTGGISIYPQAAPYVYPAWFNVKESRVFLNDEWTVNKRLLINTGGMEENDVMGYKRFSPHASLNFHLNTQQTVRLGVSVAYRTPSLGEQYSSSANPYQIGYNYEAVPGVSAGLSPEKILSREIGYLGDFHDYNTSVDLRVYSDRMSNIIYPLPNPLPNAAVWGNGMAADYTGVEATIKHSFDKVGDLTFNYANELIDSNSQFEQQNGLNNLSVSAPRNTASLLYSQRQLPHDLAFSAAWYFQSSMLGFDRPSKDLQPTHRRVDVRLSQPFNVFGGNKGVMTAVVQNLFNTEYTEYVANSVFTRRAFLTLTLRQ
jgi:iron complex outermembrane receptor protein